MAFHAKYSSSLTSRRTPMVYLTYACVILAFIAVAVIGLASLLGGVDSVYSEGQRAGVLQKFSVKGLVYKSGEGSLLLEGAVSFDDGKLSNNVFDFSCVSSDVQRQLNAAVGKRVVLHYTQYFIGPVYQSTSYTVDRVEVVR